MALSVVQHASFVDYAGTNSSKVLALGGNWTAGNMLLCQATWRDSGFAGIDCSVSDAATNTYTAQTKYTSTGVSESGGIQNSRWFICKNLAGTPATSVTFTFSAAAAAAITVEMWEISGQNTTTQPDVAVVGSCVGGVASGTDTVSSGLLTPGTDNCLLFAETTDYFQSLAAGNLTAGTGWTIDTVLSTTAPSPVHASERLQQTTAAAKAGLFSTAGAGETWITSVIAIRPSASDVLMAQGCM